MLVIQDISSLMLEISSDIFLSGNVEAVAISPALFETLGYFVDSPTCDIAPSQTNGEYVICTVQKEQKKLFYVVTKVIVDENGEKVENGEMSVLLPRTQNEEKDLVKANISPCLNYFSFSERSSDERISDVIIVDLGTMSLKKRIHQQAYSSYEYIGASLIVGDFICEEGAGKIWEQESISFEPMIVYNIDTDQFIEMVSGIDWDFLYSKENKHHGHTHYILGNDIRGRRIATYFSLVSSRGVEIEHILVHDSYSGELLHKIEAKENIEANDMLKMIPEWTIDYSMSWEKFDKHRIVDILDSLGLSNSIDFDYALQYCQWQLRERCLFCKGFRGSDRLTLVISPSKWLRRRNYLMFLIGSQLISNENRGQKHEIVQRITSQISHHQALTVFGDIACCIMIAKFL